MWQRWSHTIEHRGLQRDNPLDNLPDNLQVYRVVNRVCNLLDNLLGNLLQDLRIAQVYLHQNQHLCRPSLRLRHNQLDNLVDNPLVNQVHSHLDNLQVFLRDSLPHNPQIQRQHQHPYLLRIQVLLP